MTAFLSDSLFFGALITIACYALGMFLKGRFKLAILNPILIGVILVIGILTATGVSYDSYMKSAEKISYFLTPATVCLALPLYDKLALLKKSWKAVVIGLIAGVLTSLLCILLLCLVMKLPKEIYATLLPKSITSAIGMDVSVELGGVGSLTVASIILSGIFGSISAEWVFKLARVHSPIAKGLAIGASSHAIGTAKAVEMGKTEGAMSSLALVVCGLVTVVLAPIFYGFL